jgi:hypothetical protein
MSDNETRMWRRTWRYAVPVALVAVTAVTARAFDTSWIAPNQPISASSLKANLDEVQTRLAALEAGALGYPAVESNWGGRMYCGPAPATFSVASDPGVSQTAAYGRIMTTSEGAFSNHAWDNGLATTCVTSGTANWCTSPITFFLKNPNAARTISIDSYGDNGPSYWYVDGATGANGSRSVAFSAPTTVSVTIPTGAFALSLIVCSTDGPSNTMRITSKFITANQLTVDYDRTFHRNGM